ncbi:hypothetical protein ACFLZF_00665 [Nanoarchaeota archaeon]
MKNKKASHVGFILSFVIFVTFLIFLFSIFGSPFKFSRDQTPLVDYLETELNSKFTSNLTIITISPPLEDHEACIKIDINNLLLDYLKETNTIIKDKNNNILDSKISGKNLFFTWPENENFFKIYYSEEINTENKNTEEPCYSAQNQDIKFITENKYFSTKKIYNLFEEYNSNYETLKEELNFPSNNNFALSFIDANEEETQTDYKETTTDIYAREIPIQYINESANINSGFINIKVW